MNAHGIHGTFVSTERPVQLKSVPIPHEDVGVLAAKTELFRQQVISRCNLLHSPADDPVLLDPQIKHTASVTSEYPAQLCSNGHIFTVCTGVAVQVPHAHGAIARSADHETLVPTLQTRLRQRSGVVEIEIQLEFQT